MSDQEIKEQNSHYKKVENIAFKITLLQLVSIACILGSVFAWYMGRDERAITSGSATNSKIDKVIVYFKAARKSDSLFNRQQRIIDSLTLANKFNDFRNVILSDIDNRLAVRGKRLDALERRMGGVLKDGMIEVKKQGPNGPVTLVPILKPK